MPLQRKESIFYVDYWSQIAVKYVVTYVQIKQEGKCTIKVMYIKNIKYNNRGVIFNYSSSSHIESEITWPIQSIGYVPDTPDMPRPYQPGFNSTQNIYFEFFTAMFLKIPFFWDVLSNQLLTTQRPLKPSCSAVQTIYRKACNYSREARI